MLKRIRKNLFEYLPYLDKKKDFPAIKKYLESPFFEVESRGKVIKLFELITKHHPNYKGKPELKNASLNKKLNISFVQNLKSTLITCIEDYLRIKRVKENDNWSTLLLTESLDELNMNKLLLKIIDDELSNISTSKAYTAQEYYFKYQLLFKKHSNLPDDKNKINDTSLEEAIQALSYYYLYTNLINLIANKMESSVFNQKPIVFLAKNMVNSVQDYQDIKDPNIATSFYILKYLDLQSTKKKLEIYYKLKKLTTEKWEEITPFNRHEIYLNTINIINNLIFIGIDFEQEQFENHKFWIDKKIHKFYNKLNTALFMSIVVSASTVNEFDWSINFISQNDYLLIESEKNETILYCKAYVFFKQKRYDEALHFLNSIRFLNPLFELNLKMLELKCLFEKNINCRFKRCLKNLESYIKRHKKLAESLKLSHLNFILYIGMVAKAKQNEDVISLKKIRTDIEGLVELNSKLWILKKIEEIVNPACLERFLI